jgi:hypothetical protein
MRNKRTGLSVLMLAWPAVMDCARPGTVPPSGAKPVVRALTTHPEAIHVVALQDGVAYALTASGQIRTWDIAQGAQRTLDRGNFVALAPSGTVALTRAPLGASGDELEAWAVPSNRQLQIRRFENGVRILGISESVVLLDANYPQHPCTQPPCGGFPKVLPPLSRMVLWDFASGDVDEVEGWLSNCRAATAVSMDRERVVCADNWMVFSERSGHKYRRAFAPDIAPEWKAPPERHLLPGEGPPSWLWVTSTVLTKGSSDVYFSYTNRGEEREWRLERWTPDLDSADSWLHGGTLNRLAVDGVHFRSRVLAASPDGKVLVLGGRGEPLVLRRGPGYEAEKLAEDSTNVVATVTDDGTRVLTGHDDGALCLWDVGTRRVIAAASRPGSRATGESAGFR